MTFLKRMVLGGFLLSCLAAAVVLQAAPGRPRACGQPTGFAAFLQKVHVTNAKFAPCAMTAPDSVGLGQRCIEDGHHCNDGSGPGRCLTLFDPSEVATCVCRTKN